MTYLIVALLSACLAAGSDVEIIAHRGESADAPENTMAAFRLAWERKLPAIELDVYLTQDEQLIVAHDADTKRTTGTSLMIKQSTLAVLQKLDAGRWKGERWAGEKMPALDEALATIPDGARCFIEIKVGPEAVPALVKSVAKSGKRPEQLAVISFNAKTVAEAKRQLPNLQAYWITGFKQDKETKAWSPTVNQIIDQAMSIHADGVDVSYNGPVDAEFVKTVKATGLKFFVWTIDDPVVAQKFANFGVNGITTNKGGVLKQHLAK